MVSKGPTYSSQIYEFLEDHPKYKLRAVRDVFNRINPKTVKSAYYRWHRKRNESLEFRGSETVSKKGSKNNRSQRNSKKASANLSKIDDPLVEAYLLELIDFDDPNVNVARIIVAWVEKKNVIKVESSEKEEFDGVDFEETYNEAKSYIDSVKSKVPS